jgi:2-oxoacid:acceptor oxidoreductase delta subunit (pyruvate/2-ketoisovalerate family)
MERFVADMNLNNHRPMELLEGKKDMAVAIVGSGPAGLSCAYQLARRGYLVLVFESYPEAGGMLRVGIPQYRLPREILNKEIADIQALGVEIATKATFGKDVTWRDLEPFRAVFIATGAHKSKSMGVPGEEGDGAMSGLMFLRDLNLGKRPAVGKKVAVIGGGNTAIDAARSSLRLGSEVTIVYRRSRSEMPAVPDEVDQAEREGVKILFLAAPIRIESEKNSVTRLECVRMRLAEPDASGRRKPVPVEGSNFTVEVDTILSAIGEDPNLDFAEELLDVENAHIRVDDYQSATREGTFAGGDAATNPLGTVVDAIRSGKNAALSIHEYLGGKVEMSRMATKVVAYEDVVSEYFRKEKRAAYEQTPAEKSIVSFQEVNKTLEEPAAYKEANRCFSCGICTYCNNCMIFCPDVAISRDTGDGYTIDYDHCKGCGICVEECPREAMALEEELKWRLQK